MATKDVCDPCFLEGKSTPAKRFCTDCEEKLCKDCSEFHCRNHDSVCCGVCIPEAHQSCQNVLPLEVASEGIKSSHLMEDILCQMESIDGTLKRLLKEITENLSKIENIKSALLEEISMIREILVKQITDLTNKFITDLNKIGLQVTSEIEQHRESINKMLSEIDIKKKEINLIKSQGTNNQLFMSLKRLKHILTEKEQMVTETISACHTFEITSKTANVQIESLGSVSLIRSPCEVKLVKVKEKQTQAHSIITPIEQFEYAGAVNLKLGDDYDLTDIAVTADNQIILCNYGFRCGKVYIYDEYKEYRNEVNISSSPFRIALIPDTDRAVVTLPNENSIQFINVASMTKMNKVKVNKTVLSSFFVNVFGIAATTNTIIVGGNNKMTQLDTEGRYIKSISIPGISIDCVIINTDNNILLSGRDGMCCIDNTGTILYRYALPGKSRISGMTVDRYGDVYIGEYKHSGIHRLSKDGQLKDILFKDKHGMRNLNALTFNNNSKELIVIRKGHVDIFSCS